MYVLDGAADYLHSMERDMCSLSFCACNRKQILGVPSQILMMLSQDCLTDTVACKLQEQKQKQREKEYEKKRDAKARDRQMYYMRHTRDYEMLELPVGASRAEVKAAYRKLAKVRHGLPAQALRWFAHVHVK